MAYIASEDYTAKRIYLHADTATATSLDLINVYLEHIIRRAVNANGERRFPRMVLSLGNESAGGTFTPQYVDLQNGVRLVPYNTSHAPLITPTPLISRAENLSGRDLFDRSSLTSGVEVDIDYRPEISGFKEVNVGGGTVDLSSVLSAIAAQTAALTVTLSGIETDIVTSYTGVIAKIDTVNVASSNIDLKVSQIWNQLGLDPSDPINYQVNSIWNYVV
jgi:hypothetical protein